MIFTGLLFVGIKKAEHIIIFHGKTRMLRLRWFMMNENTIQ